MIKMKVSNGFYQIYINKKFVFESKFYSTAWSKLKELKGN